MVFLVAAAACLLGLVAWAISCSADYNAIANDPAASGIDLFVVPFYAIGYIVLLLIGLVCSVLTKLLACNRICSVLSVIGILIFALGLLFALPLTAAFL